MEQLVLSPRVPPQLLCLAVWGGHTEAESSRSDHLSMAARLLGISGGQRQALQTCPLPSSGPGRPPRAGHTEGTPPNFSRLAPGD
jgi:hypothetical protein